MAEAPIELAIQVRGLKEMRDALRDAGDGFGRELGQAGKKAAEIVAAATRARVPSVSGRARGSVRATAGRGGKVVAGGAKAPYYPWLDFGGRVGRRRATVREFIPEGRYMYPTFAQRRGEVLDEYLTAVGDILERAGLV